MERVVYVTGNKYKVELAENILNPLGIEVVAKKIECPEIQADTIEEVSMYSSQYASNFLQESTLKNDSGLVIPALNNFPSAYTKYVEETIGEDGILKLMEGIENREAYFIESLAYTEYGKDPVVFVSKTKGTIAKEKRGTNGWSWDFIFIPEGQTKTLAEFPDDEKWKLWDDSGYTEFAEYLKKIKEAKQVHLQHPASKK